MNSLAPGASSPEPAPAVERLSQILWSTFGWMLLVIAVTVVAAVFGAGVPHGMGAPQELAVIFGAALSLCASSLVMLAIARRCLREMPPAPPARPFSRAGSIGLLLMTAAAAAATARVLAPGVTPGGGGDPLSAPPGLLVAAAVFAFAGAVLITPLAEELFFRDYLWRRLAPYGPGRTAMVTLVIWALVHFRNPVGTLAILPLGLLVTWTRDRTGSPRLGIALHMMWNAVCYLVPIVAALLRG